jgi:hypothetical protein
LNGVSLDVLHPQNVSSQGSEKLLSLQPVKLKSTLGEKSKSLSTYLICNPDV